MLNVTDLSVARSLEAEDMSEVRGGTYMSELPKSFFGVANAPIIDTGVHALSQGQAQAVDQSGNLGGFNIVASDQTQKAISGQVVV